MRRRLINYETFQNINENSLSKSEFELVNSEDVLARALGEEQLSLHCFDETSVTFETRDNAYVHAGYRLDGKNIIFENIEQLVIDEASAKKKSFDVLSKMFDEMLNDNEAKAAQYYKEYITMPSVRRGFSEGKLNEDLFTPTMMKKKMKKGKKFDGDDAPKSMKDMFKKKKKEDSKKGMKFKIKGSKKKLKEWYALTENVMNYIDYQEFGPVANQSAVKRDDKGNIVAIKLPNSHLRNEGKVLSFNWKTLTADNVVLRAKMKNLAEDINFCKAMADLKKCNALSDDTRLQNVLEAVVVRWPNVIYLTQTELAETISRALDTMSENQYGDEMCEFMAEAILRTAAHAYSERVSHIIKLSGLKFEASDDAYLDFQNVAERFYKFLDENMKLEMQVYVDLYNALVEVHKLVNQENNAYALSEVNGYLKELRSVIEQESEPTLELAGDVANWLANLVETNLETGTWNVSNDPFITVSGDHPNMAKLAAKPYSPTADFSGDWGDPAPVSDGKNYKGGKGAEEMRNDAWGNWANDDTWPAIVNPYTPKAGVWTMKGEKGADVAGDSDWSRWQSGDTWPNLQNPNTPKEAGGPGGTGYKMKNDNLVVDQ